MQPTLPTQPQPSCPLVVQPVHGAALASRMALAEYKQHRCMQAALEGGDGTASPLVHAAARRLTRRAMHARRMSLRLWSLCQGVRNRCVAAMPSADGGSCSGRWAPSCCPCGRRPCNEWLTAAVRGLQCLSLPHFNRPCVASKAHSPRSARL
eukprot:363762-Chlamydomonas_euryale.AAC.1